MGTRGLIGFIIKGKRRGTYNHFDSYPSGMGNDVIRFILSLDEDGIKKMQELVENLIWLDPDEDIQEMFSDEAKHVLGIEPVDGVQRQISYAPEHKQIVEATANRDILTRVQAGQQLIIDNTGFIEDGLFCEYAYLIDFERRVVEVEGIAADTVTFPFKGLKLGAFDEYEEQAPDAQDRFNKAAHSFLSGANIQLATVSSTDMDALVAQGGTSGGRIQQAAIGADKPEAE